MPPTAFAALPIPKPKTLPPAISSIPQQNKKCSRFSPAQHPLRNRHRGSSRLLTPATPPGRAGPHPAVQRVTPRQRTSEVDQARRSKRGEARKTEPDCSPDATGRGDCPPFVRRGPYRHRGDVASRTELLRVSTASRS